LLFGQHKNAVARGKIKYVLDAPGIEDAGPWASSEKRQS
jgi:hypothetical protein